MCVSPDVVAQRLGTVDAAVRSSKLLIQRVGFEGASSGGAAIIKVLHHYHQFTVRRVRRKFRLVMLGAAGGGAGSGAAELVVQEVIRWSVGPLERRDDFRLKETHRK